MGLSSRLVCHSLLKVSPMLTLYLTLSADSETTDILNGFADYVHAKLGNSKREETRIEYTI